MGGFCCPFFSHAAKEETESCFKKLYEIFKKFLHTMAGGAIIASRKEKEKFSV